MNIRRIIRDHYEREAVATSRKTGVRVDPREHADAMIASMSNDNLLDVISDAVDALLADHQKKREAS